MKRTGLILTFLSAILAAPFASAAPVFFSAELTPEVLGATGSGSVLIGFDDVANSLSISASWTGLSGTTTVAHIHCCTAAPDTGTVSVAVTPGTLPGFPVGDTSGAYEVTLDLSDPATYTAGFVNNFGGGTIEGAKAALFVGLGDGSAYFNIHTTAFPGGEIRGFTGQTPSVPEPLSLLLLGLGLLTVVLSRRHGRRNALARV